MCPEKRLVPTVPTKMAIQQGIRATYAVGNKAAE